MLKYIYLNTNNKIYLKTQKQLLLYYLFFIRKRQTYNNTYYWVGK